MQQKYDKPVPSGSKYHAGATTCSEPLRPPYLLDQIDTSEQVHSEIDEDPVDSLPLVLLLFEHEHVVVKELLELLVGEVDADLLETVVLLTKITKIVSNRQ